MSEKEHFESHLAVSEKRALKLKIEIEGLIKSLRGHLDPLAKVEKLNAPIISHEALSFAAKHSVYMETLADIAKAKELLGIDQEKPAWP